MVQDGFFGAQEIFIFNKAISAAVTHGVPTEGVDDLDFCTVDERGGAVLE